MSYAYKNTFDNSLHLIKVVIYRSNIKGSSISKWPSEGEQIMVTKGRRLLLNTQD